MNNLVNAELAFCEELSVGMETYIRPLQAILPESTHTAMFLGLSEVIMRMCMADLSHQLLHSLAVHTHTTYTHTAPLTLHTRSLTPLTCTSLMLTRTAHTDTTHSCIVCLKKSHLN